MRKFYISDIHGNYAALIKLLDIANIDLTIDHLIIGGDMIDRGYHSGKVLKRIKKLQETNPNNVHVIIGNHEEMMAWYLKGMSPMWYVHGGLEAIESFETTFKTNAELNEHLNWAVNLPMIYEDDEYVFTHAGLDFFSSLEEQPREILWMEKPKLYSVNKKEILKYTGNKKIVHGHTPNSIVSDDGARISCDTGCEVLDEGGLSLINLTDREYFYCSLLDYSIVKKKVRLKSK